MRRRFPLLLLLTAAVFLFGGMAKAQGSDEREDGGGGRDNYAFGIGAGLIEPRGTTETYFTANLRIRGHRGGEGDEDRPRQGGITGYFEPEVGYWTRSSSGGNRLSGSDTLVGANLVGVVPLGRVDNFFGIGAGVHFVDAKLLTGDATETGSKSKLGLNAQFGVDIYLTNRVSLFGTGRFDLVQDASDNVQSKVYVGVRTRF